jgi:ankyrin repeat protein
MKMIVARRFSSDLIAATGPSLVLLSVAAIIGLFCGCAPRPALVDAAEEGNLEKVKLLLKQGRSINERDPRFKFGWTPLIAAIYQQNTNVVHYLIASGADVNIPDNDGETAIMRAMVSDENLDVLKDLIAHGADLNARDKMGATVLSYASSDPPKPRLLEVLKAAMVQHEQTK